MIPEGVVIMGCWAAILGFAAGYATRWFQEWYGGR